MIYLYNHSVSDGTLSTGNIISFLQKNDRTVSHENPQYSRSQLKVIMGQPTRLSGYLSMRKSRVWSEGTNFDNIFLSIFFLVDDGREDPNITINPPAQRHFNGISLAGR